MKRKHSANPALVKQSFRRKPIILFALMQLFYFTSYAQISFGGLVHSPVGNVTLDVKNDTLTTLSQDSSSVSGFDILLGEAKGFGFTFTEIDPFLSIPGAYKEWRMIGELNGSSEVFLWSERHTVNNTEKLKKVDVYFDTSPVKSESNGLKIRKNGTLVYEGNYQNGLIYSIAVDPKIVTAAEWYCRPIPELWDATCVARPIITFSQAIITGDGTTIDLESGDDVEIETFAVNPSLKPSFCSKIESRSQFETQSQFYDESIVVFENRIPFESIGYITFRAKVSTCEVSNLDKTELRGFKILLDEAKGFGINWEAIGQTGDNYSLNLSSKGLVDGEIKTLGSITHQYNSSTKNFQIETDYSAFETNDKVIQIVKDGNVIKEFSSFKDDIIATMSVKPSGCGKLIPNPKSTVGTVCYFFKFDDDVALEVANETLNGSEIRILSETKWKLDHFTEFSILVKDLEKLVVTDAEQKTLGIAGRINETESAEIYPNPSFGTIKVNTKDLNGEAGQFSIYNSFGLLVSTGKISAEISEIDVSTFDNGTYYITLKNDSVIKTGKFIKVN